MSATPRCAVGIARCIGYESQRVEEAVSLAVERAGGMASGDWQDVLLKTNLLAPRRPEDAVTTHPEVLRGWHAPCAGKIRMYRFISRITPAMSMFPVFSGFLI